MQSKIILKTQHVKMERLFKCHSSIYVKGYHLCKRGCFRNTYEIVIIHSDLVGPLNGTYTVKGLENALKGTSHQATKK